MSQRRTNTQDDPSQAAKQKPPPRPAPCHSPTNYDTNTAGKRTTTQQPHEPPAPTHQRPPARQDPPKNPGHLTHAPASTRTPQPEHHATNAQLSQTAQHAPTTTPWVPEITGHSIAGMQPPTCTAHPTVHRPATQASQDVRCSPLPVGPPLRRPPGHPTPTGGPDPTPKRPPAAPKPAGTRSAPPHVLGRRRRPPRGAAAEGSDRTATPPPLPPPRDIYAS